MTILVLDMVITQTNDEVYVGQPIEVEIQIRNQSSEDLSVTVKIGSQLIEYTGEILRNLYSNEKDTRKIKIAKGSGISIFFHSFSFKFAHTIILIVHLIHDRKNNPGELLIFIPLYCL